MGSLAYDQVETPFGKTGRILGGAATYIGLSASHFEKNSMLVSVVGDDFAQEHFHLFRRHGMDTRGVKVVKGGKTFFWAGRYGMDMNTRDTLATELNVLAGFQPELPAEYRQARYMMLGNLTPCIQKDAIRQMEKRPALICMDTMNFWMDRTWDDLVEVLGMVDVLTVNDEEARQLSGECSLAKAARKIREMGPKYVIVKKGEHGAALYGEEQSFFAPAMPIEDVYDPTGAGDAFAGGFMGYISMQDDTSFETLKRALVYGSVVASFCVEDFGTKRLVSLTRDDIEKRLRDFVRLSCFTL